MCVFLGSSLSIRPMVQTTADCVCVSVCVHVCVCECVCTCVCLDSSLSIRPMGLMLKLLPRKTHMYTHTHTHTNVHTHTLITLQCCAASDRSPRSLFTSHPPAVCLFD